MSSQDLNSIEETPELLKARLSQAYSQIKQLTAERDEFRRQFEMMVGSSSWRLTQPLRFVAKLLRAVLPVYRSLSLDLRLQPFRSLELKDDFYKISGPSPAFDLELESGDEGLIEPGWYSFDALVKTDKGTLYFFLYLGRKNGESKGFSEAERFLLSFDDAEPTRHPIYIPAGISFLRLEVYDFTGEFQISNLKLKALGSLNILHLLFNKHIQPLLSQPSILISKLSKAYYCWKEGGLLALRAKVFGGRVVSNYSEWVERFDSFTDQDIRLIKEASAKLELKPKISIITPVYNPPSHHFKLCLDSVLAQGYENWELCLSDDCSTNPETRKIIKEYAELDSRIKFVFREKSGHISAASNSAIEIATGEYLAFLDHDDELTPDAIYMVAREINQYPDAKLIYSDEDKKTSYGMRVNPHFKSDWNPELLLHQNYICHFLVIKKDLVSRVGSLRSEFDGAQDWDLILRVCENIDPSQIRHIPHILYHWTIIQSSTAQSTSAKPYVMEAQVKAVQGHLDRTGQNAKAKIWHSISQILIERFLEESAPKVSLVILTRDKVNLLKQCVDSILEKTAYKNYEIVILDNGSIEEATFEYFKSLASNKNIKIVRDNSEFNFSALNNLAVQSCSGEVLGFLNNDLEVIKGDWLERMLAQAIRPEVGAVGARLLFPNNLLQHAGVILGIGGVAGHNHKGRPREDPGYFNRAILGQNLSAVTAACLLMRRDVFDSIKGFDEQLSVAFNDIDLCLRIREAGYKIIYEPKAELYHYESASRGAENTPEKFARFEREVDRMKRLWNTKLVNDPFYNPNLTNLSEDFMFAFPPRVKRAWKS